MEMFNKDAPLMENVRYFLKWSLISCCIGLITGVLGTVFGHSLLKVTVFFKGHLWMLWLLPLAGVLIVWIYLILGEDKNRGTNMVIESIRMHGQVSFMTAPAIFCGTLLTQVTGGSAGREGAALQIGASIGSRIGTLLRLDEKDQKIALMCGMSGTFAALFGTPMAAAVFSMEVASIGVMYYAALAPCIFASFIGASVSRHFHLKPEAFAIGEVPGFDLKMAVLIILLGILCALVAALFCICLHGAGHFYKKWFPSPYMRVAAGALLVIALTVMSGGTEYNGSGIGLIEKSIEGEVSYTAFLWKIVLTSVTLEAGFKGGEIVPTLAIGASFGALFGALTGQPHGVMGACGMLALFVGVTNCPISTLLIGFELFGYTAMPYFVFVIGVSFTLSGYYSLYSSQKFAYSKIRNEYIDRMANETVPAASPQTPKENAQDGTNGSGHT